MASECESQRQRQAYVDALHVESEIYFGPEVTGMARLLCKADGHDPNIMTIGQTHKVLTNTGQGLHELPTDVYPLWCVYVKMAEVIVANEVEASSKGHTARARTAWDVLDRCPIPE